MRRRRGAPVRRPGLREIRASIAKVEGVPGGENGLRRWPPWHLAHICGLRSHDLRSRGPEGPGTPGVWRSGEWGDMEVGDPVAFAAWLEERLRTEERWRAEEVARHGPEAVAGGRSRGRCRATLRLAVRAWTEQAQRWVVRRAARAADSSPDVAENEATLLWETARRVEAVAWRESATAEERGALLTTWRLGGAGAVAEMLGAAGVWERALHRYRREAQGREGYYPSEPGAGASSGASGFDLSGSSATTSSSVISSP